MEKSMFIDYDITKSSEYCAERIKAAGFTHTFLWWQRDSDSRFEQVRICEKLGLEIETAHTSFDNINSMWLEGIDGDGMMEYLVRSVREAKEYGIPVLIVHLSSTFTPPPFNELGLSRYRKVCDEAEKQGVMIAFENLRRVDYLDYIMENIDSPSKRFCFDCGHEFIYNNGAGVLEKYSSLLSAFHLHDNFGKNDDHLLPFDAKINWETLAERISQIDTDIPVTLEVMKKDAEPDFAEKAFERVCHIEKLIKAHKKLSF